MSIVPRIESGIYAITHVESGKRYIGRSVHIPARWSHHLMLLRRGRHHSPRLQRAWDEHGEDAFAFTVLEEVTDRAAIHAREAYYIKTEKPALNGTTHTHCGDPSHRIILVCSVCGKEFMRYQVDIRVDRPYCSHPCYWKGRWNSRPGPTRLLLVCPWCGKEFTRGRANVLTKKPCCCKTCAQRYRATCNGVARSGRYS